VRNVAGPEEGEVTMPDDIGLPLPPPAPDPAVLALANVRSLIHQGHVADALETAMRSALVKGKAAVEQYNRAAQPATADAAARQFLQAIQAVAEELERLALAVAEGEKAEG
jgi:hypothetical protein